MPDTATGFSAIGGTVLVAAAADAALSLTPFWQSLLNYGGMGILAGILLLLLMRQEKRYREEAAAAKEGYAEAAARDRAICDAEIQRVERHLGAEIEDLRALMGRSNSRGQNAPI